MKYKKIVKNGGKIMKKTWKNVEFNTKDENYIIKHLKCYLKAIKVKFETSGAYGNTHFEIFCNDSETEKINNYIDMCIAMDRI
jgi:hypothetical protein